MYQSFHRILITLTLSRWWTEKVRHRLIGWACTNVYLLFSILFVFQFALKSENATDFLLRVSSCEIYCFKSYRECAQSAWVRERVSHSFSHPSYKVYIQDRCTCARANNNYSCSRASWRRNWAAIFEGRDAPLLPHCAGTTIYYIYI